ncbi:MAG: heme ABC exporter ATP-binding protein CcmA [Chloroflexi bacterium]|nr:heme ABC exporter ATP-binding protein CcmA [Chloroflexota bacterium]
MRPMTQPIPAEPTILPLVHAEAITKRYGYKVALRQVSLDVPAGQFVALFGPNGAGKTTLIKIFATLLRPSEGQVTIAGLDTRKDAQQVRAQMGLVSHASLLYETLTAAENLIFNARLYGMADPAARAAELLDQVGLTPVADDPVRTFSRGMKQRLSIARALVPRPALLLLDEPFTGLDQSATATLRDLLAGLRAQGRTVFMITHDLEAGLDVADRALILHRGRLVHDATTTGHSWATFRETYQAATSTPTGPDAERMA